jgi:uncharacterized membrane protein
VRATTWLGYASLSAIFAAVMLAALLALNIARGTHERAPLSAWVGIALMLVGAVVVARS